MQLTIFDKSSRSFRSLLLLSSVDTSSTNSNARSESWSFTKSSRFSNRAKVFGSKTSSAMPYPTVLWPVVIEEICR